MFDALSRRDIYLNGGAAMVGYGAERGRYRTVVVGLGNPLMGDDGVGVRVVEELRRRGMAGVDLVDGGTAGSRLLHVLERRDRAVFVDCAQMGMTPGCWRRFCPMDVRSRKGRPTSLHAGDLMAVLDLAARLGDLPGEVVIIGIEPDFVGPRLGLSTSLSSRLADYAAIVVREAMAVPGCRTEAVHA